MKKPLSRRTLLRGAQAAVALPLLDAMFDVPARWGRYAFSDRVATRLAPPRHGDSSGVRGAAWLWPNGEGLPG